MHRTKRSDVAKLNIIKKQKRNDKKYTDTSELHMF